ncbi:MAG: hypothetical protein E7161_03320 [Firmicutes bacterium]|nr:hypothetical protein [Bacillota bacterium]
MILEALFGLITGIINLIPFELPSLPDKFQTTLDFIFDGITSSLGIIDMFIDLKFWITCAVAMTIIYNIKHIWNGIVFCINLIPSVNVSYWN